MHADLRHHLRQTFEKFIVEAEGIEPVWLMNEILSDFVNSNIDLAEAISDAVDQSDTYVRVHWTLVKKVKAFVKLLDPNESN